MKIYIMYSEVNKLGIGANLISWDNFTLFYKSVVLMGTITSKVFYLYSDFCHGSGTMWLPLSNLHLYLCDYQYSFRWMNVSYIV